MVSCVILTSFCGRFYVGAQITDEETKFQRHEVIFNQGLLGSGRDIIQI